jgi:hypothetical protein
VEIGRWRNGHRLAVRQAYSLGRGLRGNTRALTILKQQQVVFAILFGVPLGLILLIFHRCSAPPLIYGGLWRKECRKERIRISKPEIRNSPGTSPCDGRTNPNYRIEEMIETDLGHCFELFLSNVLLVSSFELPIAPAIGDQRTCETRIAPPPAIYIR